MIYKNNIEKQTVENKAYRKILKTTPQLQLVLMHVPTGEDIPKETHKGITQFIRVESGRGVAYIKNKRYNLKDGDAIIIPPNTAHYIKSTDNLKLYTIYAPPAHYSETGLKE